MSSREISLYGDYPREIGLYRQWIESKEEFDQYIAKNNGIKDCYISVYSFNEKEEGKSFGAAISSSAKIDRIFLDFDNKRGHECFQVVRDFLLEKNLIFLAALSGKNSDHYKQENPFDVPRSTGFHFYIFLDENSVRDATELRIVHEMINKHVQEKLKSEFGIELVRDADRKSLEWHQIDELIDPTVVGDVAQIARVINTFNTRRNRFCVPLEEADLFKSPEELCELTRQQRLEGDFWIGSRTWKINRSVFSEEIKNKYEQYANVEFKKLSGIEQDRKTMPPCINAILDRNSSGINLRHDERVLLASFLINAGLKDEEIVLVFSKQPDFDPAITTYQVGQCQGYMPASCKNLAIKNLCRKNDRAYQHPLCFRNRPIKNPLNFYKQISKIYDESH